MRNPDPERKIAEGTIGVGVLGYGMMGRAHSSAYLRLPQVFKPLSLRPRLVAIAARSAEKVADIAGRFGYETSYLNWEELIADERVQLFDNSGPNYLHMEPCIAAAKAGKHIICEKPLARNAAEARLMLEAVQAAGVSHMCGFNYRFLPAIRLARKVISAGQLGDIFHFRAHYLQPSLADPAAPHRWRQDQAQSGYGVLGDLGSHIIDLARFLVGEPSSVSGATAVFTPLRPAQEDPSRMVEVATDDAFHSIVQFENGATGVLEASKVCLGSQNRLELEVNGSEGSLRFNLDRLNELEVYLRRDEDSSLAGFRSIHVTGPDHPFIDLWYPRHALGWEHTFVHELGHLMEAIAGNTTVEPLGATFEDGYRAAVISDAIAASALSGNRVAIDYEGDGSRGESGESPTR